MLTSAKTNPVRMRSPYPETDSGLRDFLDKIVIKISLFTGDKSQMTVVKYPSRNVDESSKEFLHADRHANDLQHFIQSHNSEIF